MNCPSCGRRNPNGTAYCKRCGRWLAAGRALGVTYQQSLPRTGDRAGRGRVPGGLAIAVVLLAVLLLVGGSVAVLLSTRPPGSPRPTQFAAIPTTLASSLETFVQATAPPSPSPSPVPSSSMSLPPSILPSESPNFSSPSPIIQPTPTPRPPPVARFSWSQQTATLEVHFTDVSTGAISGRAWDFGDGGSSTKRNPNHTYSSDGIYTVTLRVAGPRGSDVKIKQVTVTLPPTPTPSPDSTPSPEPTPSPGPTPSAQ